MREPVTDSGTYVTPDGSSQIIQQTTRIGRKRQVKKKVVSDEPELFFGCPWLPIR